MKKYYFNKFDFDINYKQINKDFDILKISKTSGNNYLSYQDLKILDALLADKECGALSVCFTGGSSAFALYEKGKLKTSSFNEWIHGFPDTEELIAVKVLAGSNGFYPNQLVQLFLNAVKSKTDSRFRFNNINGDLIITANHAKFRNKEQRQVIGLKVKFFGKKLSLDTITFTSLGRYEDLIKNEFGKECNKRKGIIISAPKYLFNRHLKSFERFLDDDWNGKDLYVAKKPKYESNKNKIDFFSIDPKKYPLTKVGLFNSLLETFHKKLGHYITIRQNENQELVNYEDFKKATDSKRFNVLKDKPIYLIDKINKPYFVEDIIEDCKNYFQIDIHQASEEQEDSINLRFIFNAEEYIRKGEKDKRKDTNFKTPIQNFTCNEYVKKIPKEGSNKRKGNVLKAYLRKVLTEAHIKYDINQGKLSVFDWEKLDYKNDWYFAIVERDKEMGETVYFMKISPDGSFELSASNADAIVDEKQYQILLALINDENWNFKTGKSKIDGVIMDDKGNINVISQTQTKAYPNLSVVHDFVLKGHDLEGEVLDKNEVLSYVENFIATKKTDKHLNKLRDFLTKNENEEVKLTEMKEILKSARGQGASSDFAFYFREQFGFWLKFPVRSKERVDEYYASMVGLNSILKNDEILFWAFKKMGDVDEMLFTNSNVVRKLKAWEDSDLIFDKLLETMNVDFVRIEAPTVIPFPFKFLREYQKMPDKNIISMSLDYEGFDLEL